MNKKDYLTKRNKLIEEAQNLINTGEIEDANAKMKEVENLDKEFEDAAKARANINALKDKTVVTDITDKSADVLGGKIVDKTDDSNEKDEDKVYLNAGVFWSEKWHAPDYKVSARVTGRDILSFLDEDQYIAKKFISDGFEISGRYFLNSPILVTNSADEIYSIAGAPNPPLGGVFSGATCSGLPAGFLDTPSACWAIISLIKIHKITKNEKALDRARLVADFIVDNLVINGDFYGSPMKLIANAWIM